MTDWFRPSGGVLYHLRALQSRKLWSPFAEQLDAWFESWQIPRRELVLIGPSGGHSLPDSWLNSFAQIHAYDIDPLAARMFRLRHRQARVTFHKQDMFFKRQKLSLEPLAECLDHHPAASVSFCNVLGQIPLEGRISEIEWNGYLNALRARLTGRTWASYHDLYSVSPLHYNQHPTIAVQPDLLAALRTRFDHKIEVIDHQMDGSWSGGLKKTRMFWSLTAQRLHLIEGVQVDGSRL